MTGKIPCLGCNGNYMTTCADQISYNCTFSRYFIFTLLFIYLAASGLITSWEIDGETVETVADFFWAAKSLQMVTAAMKLKDTYSLE